MKVFVLKILKYSICIEQIYFDKCIAYQLQKQRSIMKQGEKRIEKYQFNLKNVIGTGSYATVFKGRTINGTDEVAIKMIDKRLFLNAYNLKNIQSQIDIMKLVNHENIVKLYDIYQTTNNMYIITEFCDEKDLFHLLQKRPVVPEVQAKKYLKQIMKGVKYLHSNGIIHRDLKPANILIKDNICKISDFGFAKSFEEEDAVMKSIVGTPLYMSPQLLKRKKYTTKSDLWSIGLIYYEMLHGRTPWPAKNQLQLINGIYSKPVTFSKEISEKSKDFIMKCLQIQQEDRMNWEQAFDHPLVKDVPIKKIQPRQQFLEKENRNNFNLGKKKFSDNQQQVHGGSFVLKRKNEKNQSVNDISLKKQAAVRKSNLTPTRKAALLKNGMALTPKQQRSQNRKRFTNKNAFDPVFK